MKITSVIFLILSIVLIFGGVFLCKYARSHAPNDEAIDGPTIEDGQIFDKIDYSEQNVSRIALNLENSTLTLHGGAKSSYVELTNFEPNKFIGSVNNKTLTVSNNISFADYLNLDGSGVRFSGVWKTLRSLYLANDTADKTVDIYLSDEEDIKQLSLNVTGCDVRILDISQTCDITLTAVDSTVEFNSLNFSTMTFDCTKTDLSMLRIDAKSFNLEMNEGELTVQDFSAESLDFDLKETESVNLNQTDVASVKMKLDQVDLRMDTAYAINSYKRSIELENGEILLNGEAVGNSEYFDIEGLLGLLQIEGSDSNVSLRFGDTAITPPESLPPISSPTSPGSGPESKPADEQSGNGDSGDET